MPNTLWEVDLEVQNEQKCRDLFKNYYSIQLCGDSGGPLMCNNVAQGIVSLGKETGKPPYVFTRISSFLPWVKRIILQTKGTRLSRPQH
ncbi:hypothetical protein HPG69_002242 [Diceros bicornis minor]|uniref:Peptidase S1 domain-containing protein n=1 Tax=Diceros bicornis minor TaxID=77932 RepID=A0A7J7FCV6_DICBM|nr:hypothetical protein HPG69_002242 [Diceros bicornis minor]